MKRLHLILIIAAAALSLAIIWMTCGGHGQATPELPQAPAPEGEAVIAAAVETPVRHQAAAPSRRQPTRTQFDVPEEWDDTDRMESETRPDEVKATLPDEVFSDWRDRLQDVLAKMDETPQDGDYGALMDELQGILAGVPNAEIAKALTQLAASQTPQHRLDALAIIDALWSVRESPGVFMELPEESDVAAEAPADAEMDEEPEIEVRESWDDGNDNADLAATKAALFNILSGCVADPDKEVRLYSVEVLDRLPPEFGSSLHGLVLTGNYEDAKVELLSRHSGSAAYDDLAMFFQALDDRDIMISELARQNIANTIGQDFSSASEAFEWWESNAAEEEAE